MMMRCAVVAALLVTSGCLYVPVTSDPTQTGPLMTRKVEAVALKGSVIAPANVIAVGGGNVIATGGGNLIGQAGGNVITSGDLDVIGTGGGNFQVLATSAATIAGAKVYLADGHGNPLRGVAALKTDASGSYTFPRVPAGRGLMVVAEFTTQGGETARLRTLARPGKTGTVADLDAASTLVTSALARGEVGALGAFSTELFDRARATANAELETERLPDWRKPATVDTAVDQLVAEVPSLKADVESLRTELKAAAREDVQTLEADLAALNKAPASAAPVEDAPGEDVPLTLQPSAEVSPTPTPVPSVAPSQPAPPPAPKTVTERLLDDMRTSKPGAANWRYRAVNRATGAAGTATRFDAQHPEHPGTLVMYLTDAAESAWRIYPFGSETLLAHPGPTHDVAIDWVAPASGKTTLTYDLQASAASTDGVKVIVRQPGGTAVVDQVLAGSSLAASGSKTTTVQAGQRWTLRFSSPTGNVVYDGTTVKAVVEFTPDR